MSSGDAKTYLSKRNVPALFECLMTGLMFHRPTDHIQYLIECLEKVKLKGQEELRWNMFIEMQRSKTPLPPITPTNGRRPMSRERSMTPKEEASPEHRTPTPLPPIGSTKFIPDVPIVFLMGGPGCGKSTQAQLLIQKHPKWVSIPLGELLRQEVSDRGTANAKWKMVSELMSSGEMVPEDVVDTLLLEKLKDSPLAEGFIIQGFPRDMEQAMQFDRLVGRVDAVFLLDCEEETLSKQLLERAKDTNRIDNNVNTVAKRIQLFKEKTLPLLKHYDDLEKLFVLEGEKEVQEIAEDLAIVFETVVGGKGRLSPAPPKEPRPERTPSPRSGKTTPKKVPSPEPSAPPQSEEVVEAPLSAHQLPPVLTVKDEGRKPDMPQAPIVFVAGGPGSGKGTQCKRLLSRYTNAAHLSMGDIIRDKISTEGSADEKWGMVTELLRKGDLAPEEVTVGLLTDALKSKPDAHFFLIEGFPRNLEQLEDFNKQIGGQSFTILLDCEESILHFRLTVRGKESERIDDNLTAIGKKLTFFKNTTLPILKTIDDCGKLVLVDGDRDEDEIHFDMCKILDFAIYGTLPELPGAAEVKEVIEETIVPASATTTGDNIANPSYSAELDATAEALKTEDAKPAETAQASELSAEAKESSETPAADKPTDEAAEADDAAKAEESSKEEASKPEEAAKTDEAPKAEETAKAEDSQKSEDTAKAEDSQKSEDSQNAEETAKTEDSQNAEETAKTEDSQKAEETAKAEDSQNPVEAPKAEESSSAEGSSDAPAGESSEQKPADSAPASEEKKEEGEATVTDGAKETTGETEAAQ